MRHGGLQPSSTVRGNRRRAAHWRASGAAGNGGKARRDELSNRHLLFRFFSTFCLLNFFYWNFDSKILCSITFYKFSFSKFCPSVFLFPKFYLQSFSTMLEIFVVRKFLSSKNFVCPNLSLHNILYIIFLYGCRNLFDKFCYIFANKIMYKFFLKG